MADYRPLMNNEEEEFVFDGSVNSNGNICVRAKTGGWRAFSLIIGYELVEKMALFAVLANLTVYLTTKLHQGTVSSSNSVSNWMGTLFLTPLLGAYIGDTYLGRFWTFATSSCIYILGMGILTLAVSVKSLKAPECPSNEGCEKASLLQVGIFYFALYILAVGEGGIRPNLSTFGADQFDDFHPKEKLHKNSFFNWWFFIAFFGGLLGQTFIVYIQDNISWGMGYGAITGLLLIAYAVLLMGSPMYRYKSVAGSPLQQIGQVIPRMVQYRKMQLTTDVPCLHNVESKDRTMHKRCPEKEAFLDSRNPNPDIEETKQMIRVLPIWLTVIFPSTILVQCVTFSTKQAMTMDRHIGSTFEIPSGSIGVFLQIPLLLTIPIYDRLVIPLFRRLTGNPRGITLIQRIGVGMFLQSIAMVAAAVAEIIRRDVIQSHGIADDKDAKVPLSFSILIPQLVIMGIAEALVEVGKLEFFYDQAPESMRSLGNAICASSNGIGSFLSSGILTIMSNITGRHGHKSWILNNLNASRLDYYYALLLFLSIINYVVFLTLAWSYNYKRGTNEAFSIASSKATLVVDKTGEEGEESFI